MRLAMALADRLNAVAPDPFRVRAEGGWVSLYRGTEWDGSTGVAAILDADSGPKGLTEEGQDFAETVRNASYAVLSSVQDGVSEATTEPWPRLPSGNLALPGARTDEEWVYLWYGADTGSEEGAVMAFAPLRLDALRGKRPDGHRGDMSA